MGAPRSTCRGSVGTRWMQLGGARCGAGHGGKLTVQRHAAVAMGARAPRLRAEKRMGARGRRQGEVSQAEALCSRARV
jgi:hypothetical protein